MSAPALRLRDVSKRYGERTVVDGLSLEIQAGDIVGLLGPNGAGKTTTISMVAGIVPLSGGEIRVAGFCVKGESKRAKSMLGLVPQELALYEALSPEQNLRFFGKLYGLSGTALTRRIEDALHLAGLRDLANEPVRTFSGGMKRRLNIAVGMLHAPKLLILDEPTVGVDPQSRNHIFECLRRIAAESDTGILYTSHQLNEAEELCSQVAIMDHGRLLAFDRLESLLERGEGTRVRFRVAHSTEEAVRLASRYGSVSLKHSEIEVELDDTLSPLILALESNHIPIEDFRIERPTLHGLFLDLTGHELRD